ncbi:hypothetical protein FEM48_Zijuj10G0078600 [Ziziphus jujuba var. spinosa]|uniref:Uncharacterized protein n=1 Tax=Ziziphus jujuba var. spinosa TaxID=714518 RepID=A0A978UM60_ZIZJJ|nr:hypothetical protein FEM48_Zijuj10G0078600 [Ziziphus jujuba var. spinosa]
MWQRNHKLIVFALCSACIFGLASFTGAHNKTQPIIDPTEVRALYLIFTRWNATDNTYNGSRSGEQCSGAAVDPFPLISRDYKVFIKCNCSYGNGSLGHIVHLTVTDMDVAGPIPEELWTLSYLFHLDFGNLTHLKYLSIAENYFSGPLPSELGNLSELQETYMVARQSVTLKYYIHSSGVNGEIPSTFANLQNLETVSLQGNAFEGSIQLTFSALTSLLELRVSDLTNGNSSLEFIKDMKNLTMLVLRNNNISDSIPSSLGKYQKLSELDLSFNSITGEIPHSLFNMINMVLEEKKDISVQLTESALSYWDYLNIRV